MYIVIQEINDDKQRRTANLLKWPVVQVMYLTYLGRYVLVIDPRNVGGPSSI